MPSSDRSLRPKPPKILLRNRASLFPGPWFPRPLLFAVPSLLSYNPKMDFQLVSSYTPKGDQPRAIDQILDGLGAGEKHQVLLGVTGSGKTFTMAKVIEQSNRPALI